MAIRKMHADQIATDADLVRRLVAAQFPRWAGMAIEPFASEGTDNAIYRLGDRMAVRMPLAADKAEQIDKQHRWLRDSRRTCRFPFPYRSREVSLLRATRARGRSANGSTARTRRWTAFPIRLKLPLNSRGSFGPCRRSIRLRDPRPAITTSCAVCRWRRAALAVDDATWARGRGHALSQALMALPYYLETNPAIVRWARSMIDEVLEEHAV